MKTYTKEELQAEARAAATRHGISPVFYQAQIEQESSWNPKAKSSAGARGLAQFMPNTLTDYPHDPLDPIASLDAGARYMAQLTKQFGSEELARKAYNGGQGNLRKHLRDPKKYPLRKETAEYNTKIYNRVGPTPPEINRGQFTPPQAAQPQAAQPLDPALMAMREMNEGAPPGALSQPQPDFAIPNLGQGGSQQDTWQQQLAQMGQGQTFQPLSTPEVDPASFLKQTQDQAMQVQTRTLGKMFADMGAAPVREGPDLPSSIDRYLDKLLA